MSTTTLGQKTLGLAGGLLLLGLASAAQAAPDWSGVWRSASPDVFDAKATSAVRDSAPFTAEYAAKYKANVARLKTDKAFNPLSDCLPVGALWSMSLNGLYEFAVNPDKVFIFSDTAPGKGSVGAQTRRIYVDGRPQLSGDDLFPTYTGNSVGHWEGDTLVVKTVGLNETDFVDKTGAQLSGGVVVDERIRKTDANTIQDTFTITDPKALTRPWVVTRTWKRAPAGTAIVDDSCGGKRADPEALTDRGLAAAGK
jgi:hypothetical protein